MSNAVYPTLPGLDVSVVRTIMPPPVQVRTTPSQREYRARDATVPRYLYSLQYEFLRRDAVYSELQTLVGFYAARGGPFDDFLFTDPVDNQANGQLFGVGTGTATQWQLVRTWGGYAEPVWDLNGGVVIQVGSGIALASSYAVSATGMVTFVSPPASGAALSWTGNYYRRVRFKDERLDPEKFMERFWKLKRVELLSVKVGA